MSEDNVFNISRDTTDEDTVNLHRDALVEALKDLVVSVEEGDVTCLVGVAAKDDGSVFTLKGGVFRTMETITSVNAFLDLLKLELIMKLDESLTMHESMDDMDLANTNTDEVSVQDSVSDMFKWPQKPENIH